MVKTRRWRWFLVASLALIAAGAALLAMSLQPAPAESTARDAAGGHLAGHDPGDPGAIVVQGVAVHPGPGVAVLAANLTPVTGPANILAVNVPAAATPAQTAPPGAVAQDQ